MSYSKMFLIRPLCVCVLAFSCAGCIGSKVHFEDIPLDRADLTRGRPVEGSSTGFQLLCLIPIGINDRHEEAYWRLKRAAGNDFVTDIKVQESWTWAYIGTIHKTTLTAISYPEKSAQNASANSSTATEPNALSTKLAELKTLHDNKLLSDKEYEDARAKTIKQF